MEKRWFILLLLGSVIVWASPVIIFGADKTVDARKYVHPQARIENCPENLRVPGALTAEQVLIKAVEMFDDAGVQRLCICEVRWIESPVSGYLVDARGDLEMKISHGSLGEEGRYSLFRLGISDRPQGEGPHLPIGAGEEFAFVAKGIGPDGKPKWFPPAVLIDAVAPMLMGGGRAEADIKFPLVYFVKYFQDKERFASLAERYAPCAPPGK